MGPGGAGGHRPVGLGIGRLSGRFFGDAPLLIDKSAWERQAHRAIRDPWRTALEADQLLLCAVTDYELLFSARDNSGYETIESRLAGFRHLPMTAGVHRAALGAMRDLAVQGPLHHRVKLPDLLVAACAAESGVGVLHYDRDFDRLGTVLAFESRWLATPGTLD
jgi:predicted nucleic acid-binding protein